MIDRLDNELLEVSMWMKKTINTSNITDQNEFYGIKIVDIDKNK